MPSETSIEPNAIAAPAPGKGLRAWEFGLVFLTVFAPLTLVSIYAVATGGYSGACTPGKAFTLTGILAELGGLALLHYVLFRQGRTFKDLGFSFSWKDILRSILVIVLAYIALVIWWVAILVTYASLGRVPNGAPQNVEFMSKMLSVFGVLFLVLNPFFEELLARAYVITEVEFLTGSRVLAFLSSVGIQSAYHLYQGVIPAILTTSVFTVFSLYYLKTRRIVPVILAHMFFDLIALIRFL